MSRTPPHTLESNRQWKIENAAKMKQYAREYYRKNKDKIGERNKTYRRAKIRATAKLYREARRDQISQYRREYDARNRERLALQRKARDIGCSVEDLKAFLATQDDRCAICRELLNQDRKQREKHIDHCHATGKLRGTLCRRCNLTLGHVKDSASLLEAMIAYLREHQS